MRKRFRGRKKINRLAKAIRRANKKHRNRPRKAGKFGLGRGGIRL